MSLKTFDPHRSEFFCKHEAEFNPAFTSEADALFQLGMVATSYELIWPQDKRDYAKAAQLWQRAAAMGHWKAAMNLAGLYEQGLGVPKDTEKSVQIVEGLMKLRLPAAFDQMGTYHQRGIGVKGDSSRAYAFWQLAADMGSSTAQAYLGSKLNATYDNPSQGFWGNQSVGIKMLECSYAQGNGDAAEELGRTLMLVGNDHKRALQVLHDGVKFGSRGSANSLAARFWRAGPLSENAMDEARADRYSLLGDALEINPDLRFPNLDKVLPLPPATLPVWDGKRETLIDAAKGVIAAPKPKPSAGSQRTGRAHIPPDHVLAGAPSPPLRAEHLGRVPRSGYWLPQLYAVYRAHERAWDQAQVPQRYEQGEAFEAVSRASLGEYAEAAPRTVWHYMGEAVVVQHKTPALVAQGIARVSRMPDTVLRCRGHRPCPRTGIWFGSLPAEHPLAARYNRWDRQAYLEAGESFPDPAALQLDLAACDVQWLWCGDANRERSAGVVNVTVGDALPVRAAPSA